MNDYAKFIAGIITTSIVSILAWVRFRPKDRVSVDKVKSEIAIDAADIKDKEVETQIKLSKASLELAVQVSSQLDRANIIIEKQRKEIDELQKIIEEIRERLNAANEASIVLKHDCDETKLELSRLQKQMNENK